uniref:PWWP domain-containing protein n=1 Tax=Ascaris lumbricoides TaxID=6252 RepID=A0A0M3IDN3_ASCLU
MALVPYRYYPEESLAHNQCRNLDFTLVDKYGRKHAIVYFKLYHGAYPGPWCYAKIDKQFIPKPCFTNCPKEIHTKPMLKKQPREERTRNYNARIFDDISNSIFNSYDWGSPSYYSSNPKEASAKALKKAETTNQPTQTASATSTGEKGFAAANVEASDSGAGSTALSNKQQIRQERETAV